MHSDYFFALHTGYNRICSPPPKLKWPSRKVSAERSATLTVAFVSLMFLISTMAFGPALLGNRPVYASSSSPINSGPGEAWTLSFYNREPASLSSLQSMWSTYYSQADLQTYRAQFGWNVIRLSFCFVDICGSGPFSLNAHSTDGSTPDLSWLDSVVSTAAKNGFRVILSEFTFTGSGPTSQPQMLAFAADWKALAQNMAGTSNIAAYQIANEITDTTVVNTYYGSLDGFLLNVTNGIRSYEPQRTVVWATWPPYSPSTSNLYRDWHVSVYQAPGGTFSQCMPYLQIAGWPVVMANDYNTYGIPTLNGEINAQHVTGEPYDSNGYPICDAQAVQWIGQMIAYKIPYILWGYSQYRSNWDYILQALGSAPLTTVSSTPSTSSQLTSTAPSTSSATTTSASTSQSATPTTTTSQTSITNTLSKTTGSSSTSVGSSTSTAYTLSSSQATSAAPLANISNSRSLSPSGASIQQSPQSSQDTAYFYYHSETGSNASGSGAPGNGFLTMLSTTFSSTNALFVLGLLFIPGVVVAIRRALG